MNKQNNLSKYHRTPHIVINLRFETISFISGKLYEELQISIDHKDEFRLNIYDQLPKEYKNLKVRSHSSKKSKKDLKTTYQTQLNSSLVPTKRTEPLSSKNMDMDLGKNNKISGGTSSGKNNRPNPHSGKSQKKLINYSRNMERVSQKFSVQECPELTYGNEISRNIKDNINSEIGMHKNKQLFELLGSTWASDKSFRKFANTFKLFRTRIGEKYQINCVPSLQENFSNYSEKKLTAIEIWNPNILTPIQIDKYLEEYHKIREISYKEKSCSVEKPLNLIHSCNYNTELALDIAARYPIKALNFHIKSYQVKSNSHLFRITSNSKHKQRQQIEVRENFKSKNVKLGDQSQEVSNQGKKMMVQKDINIKGDEIKPRKIDNAIKTVPLYYPVRHFSQGCIPVPLHLLQGKFDIVS